MDEDLKVAGKYKGNDYSQYSPWSCDTIGSYIGTKDVKPKDIVAAGTVEMVVSMQAWFTQTVLQREEGVLYIHGYICIDTQITLTLDHLFLSQQLIGRTLKGCYL